MAVKLADVAERAGVSIATVSRVINGDKHMSVSKDTEERIWKCVNELGYRSSKSKSTKSVKTRNIGYILTQAAESFSDDFFSRVIYGIEQELIKTGNNLSFASIVNDQKASDQYNQVLSSGCDGIIFVGEIECDLYQKLCARFNNCLAIFDIQNEYSVDNVTLDFEKKVFEMVSRMIQYGHRRIAFIGGGGFFCTPEKLDLQSFYNYEGRLRGYLTALMVNDLPVEPEIIKDGQWRIEVAYERMSEILDIAPRVTCVFAAGDKMAIGAMRAIQERGLLIPQDISLAGFDDIEIARFLTPPLSTVSYSKEELGRTAVRKLLHRIDLQEKGEVLPYTKTMLPGEIVWRESVTDIT